MAMTRSMVTGRGREEEGRRRRGHGGREKMSEKRWEEIRETSITQYVAMATTVCNYAIFHSMMDSSIFSA